jgi:ADP-ribose pyrophosphatase YjhB (NUDIX family)
MKPGDTVYLERVLWDNPYLTQERKDSLITGKPVHELHPTTIPADFSPNGAPKATFEEWERGLGKACTDVVICTRLEDGTPAVLGLRRSNAPYKGMWYMAGGAIFAYRSIAEFLTGKAEKECGLRPSLEALIGFYRNDAEDKATSVICPCYVATVPVKSIRSTKPADGHDQWQLFTAEDLDKLESEHPEQTHWYPMHVWRRALQTMPE